MYKPGVEGRRGRGRPNSVWIDGVIKALYNRGLTLKHERMTVHNRVKWREFVNRM